MKPSFLRQKKRWKGEPGVSCVARGSSLVLEAVLQAQVEAPRRRQTETSGQGKSVLREGSLNGDV